MAKAKAVTSTSKALSPSPETSIGTDGFTAVPIRRAGPSRAMPPVSAALNVKGDLVLVFSPAFMTEHVSRTEVQVSWSPARLLRLAATSDKGGTGARKIRSRSSCQGAGELRLSALSLADLENFPILDRKRRALDVNVAGENILIDFAAKVGGHA